MYEWHFLHVVPGSVAYEISAKKSWHAEFYAPTSPLFGTDLFVVDEERERGIFLRCIAVGLFAIGLDAKRRFFHLPTVSDISACKMYRIFKPSL